MAEECKQSTTCQVMGGWMDGWMESVCASLCLCSVLPPWHINRASSTHPPRPVWRCEVGFRATASSCYECHRSLVEYHPLGSQRCLSPAKSISPSSAHTSGRANQPQPGPMAPAPQKEAIFKYVPVFLLQIAPGWWLAGRGRRRTINMNSIPSMDRHIQQTNDRLQCIKQVRLVTKCQRRWHKSLCPVKISNSTWMFPVYLHLARGSVVMVTSTQCWCSVIPTKSSAKLGVAGDNTPPAPSRQSASQRV